MNRGKVKLIQNRLAEYLSIDLDPHDFHYDLGEWAESEGLDLGEEPDVGSLSPAQLKAFTRWLHDEDKPGEIMRLDPAGAPAYLMFSDVRKLPAGIWLIHFTSASPFKAFEYGATLEKLALSTWWKSKDKVDCKRNLRDDIGDFEYVYGFAYDADLFAKRSSLKSNYGNNAVVFRSDGAVEAYHSGDEERQVIFPLCSEYDAYPIMNARDGITCECTDDGDPMEFETLGDMIGYIEKQVKGKKVAR